MAVPLPQASSGDGFEQRRRAVAEAWELLDHVYPPVKDGTASREQAEIVSLLMERSLDASLVREHHETIIANYGDIPSSVCELAKLRIEAKDLGGAEDLLRIFETHPIMSGTAKRFLDYVINHPNEWPFDELWLKDWAEDPDIRKRISAAMEAFREMISRASEARDSLDIPLEPHGLDNWHIDLIAREVGRVYDVHSIYLARKTIDECDAPFFQMLIVTKHRPAGVVKDVNALLCLPGPMRYVILDAFTVEVADSSSFRASVLKYVTAITNKAYPASEAWGKFFRNFEPALIFGPPSASRTQVVRHYVSQVKVKYEAEYEVEYEKKVDNAKPNSAATTKWLFLSIVAVASFSILFGWQDALLLAVTLALHEAGHALAMLMLGIGVQGVYLIPFFGGATVPKSSYRTEANHAFVSLMGPALSLIPTFALLAYILTADDVLTTDEGGILFKAVYALAGLNFINLLPIYPLDGGQILNALLGSINRRLAFAVSWLGVLTGLGVALYLRSFIIGIPFLLFALQRYLGGNRPTGLKPASFGLGAILLIAYLVTIVLFALANVWAFNADWS